MNQNQHIIIIISKTGTGWFSDFEILKKLELVIINNIQYCPTQICPITDVVIAKTQK
jgi:hypothetical protein